VCSQRQAELVVGKVALGVGEGALELGALVVQRDQAALVLRKLHLRQFDRLANVLLFFLHSDHHNTCGDGSVTQSVYSQSIKQLKLFYRAPKSLPETWPTKTEK